MRDPLLPSRKRAEELRNGHFPAVEESIDSTGARLAEGGARLDPADRGDARSAGRGFSTLARLCDGLLRRGWRLLLSWWGGRPGAARHRRGSPLARVPGDLHASPDRVFVERGPRASILLPGENSISLPDHLSERSWTDRSESVAPLPPSSCSSCLIEADQSDLTIRSSSLLLFDVRWTGVGSVYLKGRSRNGCWKEYE